MKIYRQIKFLLIILISFKFSAQNKIDSINFKINFRQYEEKANFYFKKKYDISNNMGNDKQKNNLISEFYPKDSLKLYSIPRFKFDSLAVYDKNTNVFHLIDFKENYLLQEVIVENKNKKIVSKFDLNGYLISEIQNQQTSEDYSVYNNLIYNKSFSEFIIGGARGATRFTLLNQYYINYLNFDVQGFNGTFIIENGFLFYVLGMTNCYMKASDFDINFDDLKIPKCLIFKKVEFNTYLKKCFCQNEINGFIKNNRFIDNYKCLKKIKNPKRINYFIKVN